VPGSSTPEGHPACQVARCQATSRGDAPQPFASVFGSHGVRMQPDLWAAGVEVVGISSAGDVPREHVGLPPGGARARVRRLDSDREFLIEASPVTHLEAIRTPLFVIHGANDPPRTPVGVGADQGGPGREGGAVRAAGVRRRGARPREAGQPARRVSAGAGVPRRASERQTCQSREGSSCGQVTDP
jgi:hypothetical protein